MRKMLSVPPWIFLIYASVLYPLSATADNLPPKAAPRAAVARPVVRPVPGAVGVQGRPGAVGVQGIVRPVGANGAPIPANREELMQSIRPTMAPAAFAKPSLDMHPATSRAAFVKPSNIRHDPNHRVGRVGGAHGHQAFVLARNGHRFHRRYYLQGGAWFWYDEAVPVGDPDYVGGDVQGLPTCDPNADDCQGTIQPIDVPPPASAFAPTDDPSPQ